MSSLILVTGGTGTLGRRATPLLEEAGAKVRVLSRHTHASEAGVEYVTGDVSTGEGVAAALDGVSTVLHLAGGAKGDDASTRALTRTAASAGVRHFAYISVIGADRMPLGYFRMKAGAEQAVVESGIPWTVLRAAQVNDSLQSMMKMMIKMPIVPAPAAVRFQPVDAGEVAARLVELTLGAPAGRVSDIAGPGVYDMGALVRAYLKAVGKRRPLLPVGVPGKVGRAYRAGDNLNLRDADIAGRTWEEFLTERVVA